MSAEVIHGDCLDVMRAMPDASVDAVVTDPPYALTGASRNGSPRQNDPSTPFGRTRLGGKPSGGFMGKIWDAELPSVEIWREVLRVMKPGAYLVAFGGPRTSHRLVCAIEDAGFEIHDSLCWLFGSGFPKHKSKLKPAHEPICLARKPAARATMLNIDECRIGDADTRNDKRGGANDFPHEDDSWTPRAVTVGSAAGRWPANVVLDEVAAGALDEQSGESQSRIGKPRGAAAGDGWGMTRTGAEYSDTGGASRFYYVAKASRSERTCDGTVDCTHPTVKPVALMRWLVRLVTPPNGVVLDPFTGSGTTGIACVQESRRFIGIEREAEYMEIARARIAHHGESLTLGVA